jgi:undecaprenyl-diphosphatase
LTEFLPVSSSGHLALLEQIWNVPEQTRLPLVAMLHVGTALAVIGFFAPRLWVIARCSVGRDTGERGRGRVLIAGVALGTIPAGLVGLLLRDRLDAAFSNPLLVAALLVVTGGVLFGTRFIHRTDRRLTLVAAGFIGLAQAIAILPGISRSGVTIAAALYLGIRREEAFEFSFLLSLPAVIGAGLLELRHIDLAGLGAATVLVGVVVAFGSGLGALVLLRKAVAARRLYWFAYYCWAAGVAALLLVR